MINNFQFNLARKRQFRYFGAAFAALALSQSAISASLSSPDRDALKRQASQSAGLMNVMMTVQDVSLKNIKEYGSEKIRADVDKVFAGLRANLGEEVLSGSYWNNGMGQIGVVVTPNGLKFLEQSDRVKTIQPDDTRTLRDVAWISTAEREAVEKRLKSDGSVVLDVILNSEIDYHVGSRGETVYKSSSLMAEKHVGLIDSLQKSSFSKSFKIIEDVKARSGASAVVRANVGWDAYYALRMAPEVRSLRIAGERRDSYWPQDVMDAASASKEVDVIISLQGGDTYSPNQGYMSQAAWSQQGKTNNAVFNEILKDVGALGKNGFSAYDGIGVFAVKLNAESVKSLFERKDPRIRDINLVKKVAVPTLHTSTQQINMPPAWSAGFRGAGQAIIVLDTGVEKNHLFFQNAAGTTRVYKEACFGTNNSSDKSICPSQNSSGDSPVGFTNSGKQYGDFVYCAKHSSRCGHGTHVAGIAGGRANSMLGYGLQGVAPDAMLVSVQVFSFPSDSNSLVGPSAYNQDILAALQAIYVETPVGTKNPYVVNMSLGSESGFSGTCDMFDTPMALAVSNLLSRGVPVVAATGNEKRNWSISYPSCISNVIKVSAVRNDSSGTVRPSYANLAPQANFSGPIFLAPGGDDASAKVESANYMASYLTVGMSGTSMAAPHVSGFYAVIKGQDANASVADVTAYISSPAGSISAPQNLDDVPFNYRRIRSSL